jgi:hypothetical protein
MIVADLRDLVTMRNDELARRGFVAAELTALRERYSGHTRRITEAWARTVGLWGRVGSLREIADAAERDPAAVKSYARARGKLRWRTRAMGRTQAELSALAFASWPTPARDAAPAHGAMPVEFVLGRLAMTELLVQEGLRFADVLDWEPAELERAWTRHGLRLSLARPARLQDSAYLAELVRAAQREADTRRELVRRAVQLAERDLRRERAAEGSPP